MTVDLDEYKECLEKAKTGLSENLESIIREASGVMSSESIKAFLDGAKKLTTLNRGNQVVISYLDEIPLVVKICGEDMVNKCVDTAFNLASRVSGEVIALLFTNLPTAARHLGDAELLCDYLDFTRQLSVKSPRSLRPLFNHTDELLSKLTLGGLKRWAFFGTEAYRRDYHNLIKYFNLETTDSLKVLQNERHGTLFIDVQRKLNLYLRALWGREFTLHPITAESKKTKSYIKHNVLYLADALDDVDDIPGLELYRAQAAHLASHIAYSSTAIQAEQLNPEQKYFIAFAEDARVEYKAIKTFPGLKKLWKSILEARHNNISEHVIISRLEQIALMLLDKKTPNSDDNDLNDFVNSWHKNIEANQDNVTFSQQKGIELFNLFVARMDIPDLHILESVQIPYRDDNRFIWEFSEANFNKHMEYVSAKQNQLHRKTNIIETNDETNFELAGDAGRKILSSDFEANLHERDIDNTKNVNEVYGKKRTAIPIHYHEWDYQMQRHRPDWTTVYEHPPERGDPHEIEAIIQAYKPIASRIKRIIDMLQPVGVQRVRNMMDGDEIDINAAIEAMIAIRSGEQPDPRITMRNINRNRDLAVMVLLDLSESTNETVQGSEKTILQLTREAATLMATAINGIGDPFAIHGFASDGRNNVKYYRIKDFDQSFDDDAKSHLAGIQGGLSTRMGAAMRHASQQLLKQSERKKLLLIVTDGEPADIDERDPKTLRHDTKKAVEELYTKGILSYCLTLDPNADNYVKRIFGANNYTVVENVERLPEKLPELFAILTS